MSLETESPQAVEARAEVLFGNIMAYVGEEGAVFLDERGLKFFINAFSSMERYKKTRREKFYCDDEGNEMSFANIMYMWIEGRKEIEEAKAMYNGEKVKTEMSGNEKMRIAEDYLKKFIVRLKQEQQGLELVDKVGCDAGKFKRRVERTTKESLH